MAEIQASTQRLVPAIFCRECGKPADRRGRSSRDYCSDACYKERKRRIRREKPEPVCLRCDCAYARIHNRQKFCQPCQSLRRSEYTKAYNDLNADLVRAKRRDDMKALKDADPELAREKRRAWREANKEVLNAKRRTPDHRAKVSQRSRTRYQKERRLVVHARMASAVYQALKQRKSGRKWESIVGYTLADLMAHLERQFLPGMSWGNMGKWHIDHIVPKAVFQYETDTDDGFKAAWAMTNLRPLWSRQNQQKHAKRTHLL